MPDERPADDAEGVATRAVDRRTSERRWHALDYLDRCRYPATVKEVGEHIALQLGETSDEVRTALRYADLPVLADGDVVEYDVESQLICAVDALDTLDGYVRRAIEVGAIEWPSSGPGPQPDGLSG
jgi:hypothetical protein